MLEVGCGIATDGVCWPPGFRPDFRRRLRFLLFADGLACPSDDGGFDEFREF